MQVKHCVWKIFIYRPKLKQWEFFNKYHKIKQGDTLSAIARRNKTTVSKLCKLNGLKETSILRLGQKIKIK